jgi:hypothetical protein
VATHLAPPILLDLLSQLVVPVARGLAPPLVALQPMFSNRIIEPYRKGTDKMINRDKSSISPINRG